MDLNCNNTNEIYSFLKQLPISTRRGLVKLIEEKPLLNQYETSNSEPAQGFDGYDGFPDFETLEAFESMNKSDN